MKYLFRCKFSDGRKYYQTSDDISQKENSKSAYYDIKDEQIDIFWLEGNGHVYLIDLTDGIFEIDGTEFKMGEEENITDRKLIYFRRHTRDFQGTEEINHQVEFCFGYEGTDIQGNKIKHIMVIQ